MRARCERLIERGITELAILTPEGSPNCRGVSQLATRMEAYGFRMGAPRTPARRPSAGYTSIPCISDKTSPD